MKRYSYLILLLCFAVFIFAGSKCSAGSTDANDSQQKFSDSNDSMGEKGHLSIVGRPAAFRQFVAERRRMVQTQLKARDINDPNVLRVMEIVPRQFFVPSNYQNQAYDDNPLPIGSGQTISQPYVVAFMTQALRLEPNSKVLEIGTGSGYQAAVCAEIAKEVYTIEIVKDLADKARKTLNELGYKNIFIKTGDGFFGWPDKAPFDGIIGTAAAERIPQPLLEQLKPGGRMILPYETNLGFQNLVLIIKDKQGKITRQEVLPVTFVPMTGEVKKKQ